MKRETIITTGACHIKHCEINNGEKRRLEHTFSRSFRIVKQLPFHFAPQQIQE